MHNKGSLMLVLVCSCGADPCPHRGGHTFFEQYDFAQEGVTPQGVEYQGEIDRAELDNAIDEIRHCVDNVPKPYNDNVYCSNLTVYPNAEQCLSVLITEDWRWSCDGREQLLDAPAPLEGCTEKGFTKDDNCPCRFRGGSQAFEGKCLIVVTPNLRMLKHELVRYFSGCWRFYEDTRLAACIQ